MEVKGYFTLTHNSIQLHFYLSVRSHLKLELSHDADQSHLDLHQSKPHSNAVARPRPKWHVYQGMTLDLLIRVEARSL